MATPNSLPDDFKPVICPKCEKVITEISFGIVRQQCPKCKDFWVVKWLAQFNTFYIVKDTDLCNPSPQVATS